MLAGAEDGILTAGISPRTLFAGDDRADAPGLGEAYTPTVVGPDGQVCAINNADAVRGGRVERGRRAGAGAKPGCTTAPAQPNPFSRSVTLRFRLAQAGARVNLEILSITGERVATLEDGVLVRGRACGPLGWTRREWSTPRAGRVPGKGSRGRGSAQVSRIVFVR